MKSAPAHVFSGGCPSCGHGDPLWLFDATDRNRSATSRAFSIYRCDRCGIAFTHPQPDATLLSAMYPDEYYPTQTFSDTYFRNHVHPVQREKLDHILSYCRAGRLLDVGCGVGFFVREASDAGFHAEGIEWSERAVEAGKQQWNLALAAGSFLAHDFGAEQFDVVTLWQVLEHLENPALALKKVRSLVRKGGIVVIAVPNFASVQATLFRRRWYHLDIPRHLFHFTPQALSRLLEQEGFRVVRRSFRSREHNWAGIFGSVFIMTPPNEGFIHRVFRKTVGKGCSAMLAGLEMLAGRGGIVTFVAIRN